MQYLALIAIPVLITLAGEVHADWPRWGGTKSCNMVCVETGLPDTICPGRRNEEGRWDFGLATNVAWVTHLGTQTYGSPVVAGDRIVIGFARRQNGAVLCLNARDGALIWTLPIPKKRSVHGHHFDCGYGICATPGVEGECAYIVSSRGEVLCLDMAGQENGNGGPFLDEGKYFAGPGSRRKPATPVTLMPEHGDILWRYDIIAELDVRPHDASSCSVLVHGNYLYVCTGNGVNDRENETHNPDAPSLVVLDKQNGQMVAKDAEGIGRTLFKGQWSSPSLAVVDGREMVLFGAGDGFCYAFEPVEKGTVPVAALRRVWKADCNPAHYRKDSKGADIPYSWKKMTKGRITRERDLWNKKRGHLGPCEIIATPVCVDGRVYVSVGRDPASKDGVGNIVCIDARTGKRLWNWDGLNRSCSTVSVTNGLLYIAQTFGKVHCLDAVTGKRHWTHEIGGQIWGSTLAADGKVYLPGTKGLAILKEGPKLELLAAIRFDTPLYSNVVAVDKTLYVATQRFLYAARMDHEGPPSHYPRGSEASGMRTNRDVGVGIKLETEER